ncbi:MAG: nicotinamide mononucleotide deamidase-related protein [Candidatus Korarchaeum sp.]|nr:nicotinamide mononucleotide deamidase-related protein [Candidatus Korarchaeum sp.]MDW8036364.1 nicotinamide mononucleotide deamidase-related protein [Candidatus Korarchaeum sp.]
MRLPEAWVISVGNELLNGRIVNTNLAWLSRKLTLDGYLVRCALTVRDDCDDITMAFRLALERGASLIVSTGGLGPTFDDMTSECLSKTLNRKHVINGEALRMVEEKYSEKKLPMTEHRVKMAMMPEGAKPIYNAVGTAPGIMMEEGSTLILVLPGVPLEMMDIFERVENLIRSRAPPLSYVSIDLLVKRVPESEAAPLIEEVMRKFNVYVKSHPSGRELGEPLIKMNITSSSLSETEARLNVDRALKLLSERLRERGGDVSVEET